MSLLALKIIGVSQGVLTFEDRRFDGISPPAAWLAFHEPAAGDYYLVDNDGHASVVSELPDDVAAPAPFEPAPVVQTEVHPDDHFRYDWLEACLKVLAAQLDGIQASVDALTTKEKTDA